jgi:hypothetical protein
MSYKVKVRMTKMATWAHKAVKRFMDEQRMKSHNNAENGTKKLEEQSKKHKWMAKKLAREGRHVLSEVTDHHMSLKRHQAAVRDILRSFELTEYAILPLRLMTLKECDDMSKDLEQRLDQFRDDIERAKEIATEAHTRMMAEIMNSLYKRIEEVNECV